MAASWKSNCQSSSTLNLSLKKAMTAMTVSQIEALGMARVCCLRTVTDTSQGRWQEMAKTQYWNTVNARWRHADRRACCFQQNEMLLIKNLILTCCRNGYLNVVWYIHCTVYHNWLTGWVHHCLVCYNSRVMTRADECWNVCICSLCRLCMWPLRCRTFWYLLS